VILVDAEFRSLFNRLKAVLASDNLQRMIRIESGRGFGNYVAESSTLLRVALHRFERDMIFDDVPISSVFRLLSGSKGQA
jgi:hypothetical protein